MSGFTLPQLVFETGNKGAAAVVSPALGNVTLSRTELKRVSLEAADAIQALRNRDALGIEGQHVVAMALPNGLPFVLAFLGVTARGVIAAPLNPAYTVPEYEFYLSDTKAGVLVVDGPNAKESFPGIVAARKLGIPVCSLDVQINKEEEAVSVSPIVKPVLRADEGAANGTNTADDASIPAPTPDTLCLILHTSGTTGTPKAVPLSHANLSCSARNVAASYDLGADDRGYLIQVLFHIHGIVASLLAPLVSGGSVVVPNKFDAAVTWIEFAALKCSWLSGTPSALQILLHAPKAGSGLGIKFLRSCSSPLLPSTFKALQEVFQCPVLEAYAMTENAHQMTTNVPSDAQPGSVGKAAGTVRMAIYGDDETAVSPLPANSEGEVCITGPSVTKGYLENPSANEKAFFRDAEGVRWFRTGDIGVLDNEGHLRIVGRRSEIINRGGEKISPLEVDEAMMLCAAPYVREAACFSVPDEFFHQEVEAAIVLSEDAPDNLRDGHEIQRLLEQRLAAFKIPKRIHYFEGKIPKGPTGKIQRVQLSKKLARSSGSSANAAGQGEKTTDLPERIRQTIIEALRVDPAIVKAETTLLELGADSMSLTRMLGNLHRLGCSINMSDVILNPTVQHVTDICVSSFSAGEPASAAVAGNSVQQVDVPAPFSVLKEALEEVEGSPSLDVVLADVAKQTGLQLDQLEEVLPLSPEQKWFHDAAVTSKWGMLDSQVSWVTVGAPIKPTVDIEKLKWAFTEVSKVEPLPRSFFAIIPGTNVWVHTIAKPDVVPLNWEEWSADSEQAALDRLQAEHLSLRYRPGVRGSKLLLVTYPNKAGETCRDLYMVDSHVLTDNTSRSMLRDNVIKLYLGEATLDNLPQVPLPSAVLTKALRKTSKENYTSKMRYWQSDIKSHGITGRPVYTAPPETGIQSYTQFRINEDPAKKTSTWTGDINGLSVLMGLSAPTLIQSIMPLAVAAFEYQGTRKIPKSTVYSYSISARSGIIPPIRNSEQSRSFGVTVMPFLFPMSLAEQSLWMHIQQASLKPADSVKHYHVESCDEIKNSAPTFVWRELAVGSVWSEVIDAGLERFAVEVTSQTYMLCMRLGIDTLMMIDGERDEYAEWRSHNGYPVSLVTVLQRCLTFLCENKENVVDLTLTDLIQAVWT
ncbi:Putative peroxisomal-coenzyme A synthetase [Cytospora mali]|uniref:Peroxisomal-coenzyme A synthetase n=1 Tax=Cytospora mali TaxID=578113 RepID=A0A194W260_CYTMA|nr:Putative peroxisomal-coenzyme A synthetase [Valsa mali]